jgi:hypothetical protein
MTSCRFSRRFEWQVGYLPNIFKLEYDKENAMQLGGDATLLRIRECLQQANEVVREVEHAPTETSEESAEVRGEALHVGAKALLLKTDDVFRLFVLLKF